ncbi:cytochrome p450, putative, partial [Perkinsus marinus ATCC 50983]
PAMILSTQRYVMNVIRFLVAGSDTTAMTVAWCLYYLALYPEIQNRARVEVDALGHDPNATEDLDRLVFVKCCILEALRLQPPAVFLLHECTHDTELDGRRIQAGTNVLTLFRKAMVADAPKRWLLPDGSSIDQARERDHLAFGGGPRQCPGKNMAVKEAVVILTLILRHFNSISLNCPPSFVRGEATFTYGPLNLELQMRRRVG